MRLKENSGFSLIELITVLGIIGILAAIAIPNFLSWLPNMRLKSAARDLYSSMQKVRILAVKANKSAAIIFDTANDRYTVCDDWDTSAGNCTGSSRQVNLSGYKSGVAYGHGDSTAPVGTEFGDNVTYSSPDNVALFDSQGLGKNSGYVYLHHKDKTTTYAIGSMTSGVIKLLKWNGNNWQ